MSVSCECCVLLGRGLCYGPIPRPDESYRLWCIIVCDIQTSCISAPVLNLLHFHISTFRSMCAVPNMAVLCSSLTSWIPGTLFRYFLNGFEMIPVAPIITGITFVLFLL